MGLPAATVPTTGILSAAGSASSCTGCGAGAAACGGCASVRARPLPAPFVSTPISSMCFRWKWTVEGDFSPTASPISRTEGGYPCRCKASAMVSYIFCCIFVILTMSPPLSPHLYASIGIIPRPFQNCNICSIYFMRLFV